MKNAPSQAIEFPVGYYPFHKNQLYNFQLNRWYSFGYFRYEDIKNIGDKIDSFNDWRNEMLSLARQAEEEDRYLNAAFYYRAAEFYTYEGSGEGGSMYGNFTRCFQIALDDEKYERLDIPYQTGFLPTMIIRPEGEKRGTIVLHGGFDSFIEEWLLMMKYLALNGFEVIGFEGPGQGAALLKHGLVFDIEWEKPVKAILDYLKLDSISLFGLSMGGWLCLRASAFEPRIKKVIANGHSIDYMKNYGNIVRWLHVWFLRIKGIDGFMNRMAMKQAKKDDLQGWMTCQLMKITGHWGNPMAAFQVWLALNDVNIHCEKVTQDVLLLSGAKDHFVPLRMNKKQIAALSNASSVTNRVFTSEDQAENHCQVGNIRLMLDTAIDWMKR